MGWTASLGVGLISAMLACVLAGWIANLCADWYQMSSFEGASGYFVVVTALLGFLAGLVLGIVVSRFLGSAVGMGFFKTLGSSLAIVAGLALVTGGTARLLADIAPKLDGEDLHLAVEIRWPPGRNPASASSTGEWTLQLGSAVNRTQRASETGPLWRGVKDREGEVAMHFSALLMFLHGQASEAFDWELRPFFLTFNTEDPTERSAVFRELCRRLDYHGADSSA
jgi:hypothetical protein